MKIFLWGTGHIAKKVLREYDIFGQYDVLGFIDNNPCQQGKRFYKTYIYAPEILLAVKVDKIIVLTEKYEEIYRQITKDLKLKNVCIENWKYFQTQPQLSIKSRILKRYKDTSDLEIKDILEYLKLNNLTIFNYCFEEKYRDLDISALYDENCGMFYVMHHKKRMYFKKSLNTEDIVIDYYRWLLIEQDEESPHKYLGEKFTVCHGDVVVDAGTAEGIFALEIIEQVSKIYLIEMDDEWIEALNETFKDYQDKVVIIKKHLTSIDDGNYAMLDSLIKKPVNFIKMDIEGNEWDALLGAEKLIKSSPKLKCAICSYHAEYDETLIRSVLTQYGLQCTVSQGYMWFPWGRGRDGHITTKLCRGIVRGIK